MENGVTVLCSCSSYISSYNYKYIATGSSVNVENYVLYIYIQVYAYLLCGLQPSMDFSWVYIPLTDEHIIYHLKPPSNFTDRISVVLPDYSELRDVQGFGL